MLKGEITHEQAKVLFDEFEQVIKQNESAIIQLEEMVGTDEQEDED